MTKRSKATLWTLLGIAGIAYVPVLAMHAQCIVGTGWDIAGVEFFTVLPLLALPFALAALVLLAVKRARMSAAPVALVAGGIFLLWIPVIWAAGSLRSYGFGLAARRARPLVAAVERYEREHGVAPASVSALVPVYLPSLPEGLPPFEIVTGPEVATRYHGNRWVLRATVRTGVINWDQFMYFPNGRYPDVGYGGWIERIDGWAYVHE